MYLILGSNKMRLLVIAPLLIFFASCSSTKSMGPQAYLNWYASPDFTWKGIDTINDISCMMRLVPKEMNIAKCAIDDCEPKDSLAKQLSHRNETIEFIIEFSSLKINTDVFEAGHLNTYTKTDKILYLSNGIKYDIKAITAAGDTLACQNILYEPSIPRKARLLATLESTKKSISQLIIKDRMITGEAIVFHIPGLNPKSIPTLKL